MPIGIQSRIAKRLVAWNSSLLEVREEEKLSPDAPSMESNKKHSMTHATWGSRSCINYVQLFVLSIAIPTKSFTAGMETHPLWERFASPEQLEFPATKALLKGSPSKLSKEESRPPPQDVLVSWTYSLAKMQRQRD